MNKLLAIIALTLGVFIGLKHFNVYDANSLLPFDITMIGALFMLATQIFWAILLHSDNQGTTFMGSLIRIIWIALKINFPSAMPTEN